MIFADGEEAVMRREVAQFLQGASQTAAIIVRENGQQVVEHWRLIGQEDVQVGNVVTQTLKIRINSTWSGNTTQWWREAWYSPSLRLFVKSQPSLDYLVFGADNVNRNTWQLTKISSPK